MGSETHLHLSVTLFFPTNAQKSCQISSPAMGCPVGKEEFRIAAGANSRHGNMLFFYSCLQKNNVVCFPKIQLVLTILLFIKKLFPVFHFKSFLKFQNHIFAYFIAVLTDGGTNCRKNLLRIWAKLLCHFLYSHLTDFPNCPTPSGMRQAYGFVNRIYEIQDNVISNISPISTVFTHLMMKQM